ncbi:MAG: DNA-binding protein [Nitrospirae bacterium CG_4_10_14_0_8_um_filter_41_23]|nr:DNA-binding protein [Nitrospirota bacterium]OIP60469.1 MAG: DNA-binding protein [Nitrospirae bacterium CG2_30_41_42]PIQ95256.1 MAG: DNA-binding protein [Nitrospirae bacterium CG11_big_fil_rev_8_21_14_0_20_41_14]PIV43888.1 MAG: DNA-binding protein [Nitrospirae bacterium CG02_land_8_20_14_3_00_41_53]PIW86517.1 MAG: DNA-binding protein [Nitrospirae bacterium CG_4_8_14_3_um_filter_41_47]PIY86185.1 MAG: DNA-binding protein [Nitrospirae bacterium CG_4_10_14_0_8_um_filter_41_23]PJA80726.1 MAG: DN
MRTRSIVGLVVVVSMFFTSSLALAAWKGYRGSGGWGMGTSYQRMYNPATVETVSGKVESVDKITPMKGMYYGIHLLLKTDKETVSVHLGPGWYIERLDMKIEKGDKVEVKGSRTTMMGKPVIIAAEVKKGDSFLKLRDENGIPVWAGWRR